MNDLNGTALAGLAAALAPHIATELAKLNGNGAGVQVQQGGGFGAQQNNGQQTGGQLGSTGIGQQQTGGTLQQGGATGHMFGGGQASQQIAPTVTPDMIQTLITPMVQNEQVKNELTNQMQQMGIQNLPDARPDQLAELYQRFQNVHQQATAAGLLGGNAGGGSPSLI